MRLDSRNSSEKLNKRIQGNRAWIAVALFLLASTSASAQSEGVVNIPRQSRGPYCVSRSKRL